MERGRRYTPSTRPPPTATRRRVGQGTQISYTGVLFAVLIGVLHAAVAPVVTVAGVHPNIVLIGVVLATALGGFGPGVMWAFVAGLMANLLVREPLGSIPLGLLLVAAAVAGGDRMFGRLAWAYPVAAVFVASIFVDGLSLGILQLVDEPLAGGFPLQRIVSAALLNTMIVAIVVLPSRMLASRRAADEGTAW